MPLFDWNDEKNTWLRRERGIAFEDIVYHIGHGDVLLRNKQNQAVSGTKLKPSARA